MLEKIGAQLYTLRNFMHDAAGIRGCFHDLKKMGYDQAQTAGCSIPFDEFGSIAKEEGIEIVGTHENFQLMVDDFEQSYKDHQALDTKIMGCGGFFKYTAAEYAEFIKQANMVGEKIAKLGGKFTYHNHSHEFVRLDNGKTAMDMLVEGLNPNTTSFVLDTYWVQHGGADVRQWIEKLTGRIDILHLKDMAKNLHCQYITEIGNGNLYWEGILESAAKAGVKYYIVEQDMNFINADPFESLKVSSEYLHKNFMK